MPNLQNIRQRINSVRSTQKITRAMKMVAAAKLRRAQEAIVRARPYAYRMREMTQTLVMRADPEQHPLLRKGEGDKVGLIIVTSDRGLCGGFNANIINRTMVALQEEFAGKNVELTVVGRRGVEALKRRKVKIRNTHVGVFDKLSVTSAARIVDDFVEAFTSGELSEVYCLYNEFKSAISQRVVLERLLPYEPPEEERPPDIYYIFEPSEIKILFELLVRNVYVQMHRVLHESAASEFGARMAAMESATRNAGELIERLTLKYNRARQDNITREVVEVIGGAEAL